MKALGGMSIGYSFRSRDDFDFDKQGNRLLKQIDVREVSLVTFPANPRARISAVKSVDELTSLSEIEDYLRDAGGLSRAEAKRLIARVRSAGLRDAGDDVTQLTAALSRELEVWAHG